ncbi:glycoside hydrolase family 3 N-terminal domain-containing protein [Sinomonas mesophila]|uniref:glycoside hydrolase family 3 N-terminal domain-containing protein n=1 Tax=Sinomonas mesophila TaxID=1531955 RepID=UPI0009876C82|nr:glycoside hydrolase family 3 N-terminal domain-containing protein [Sinomonas mesophila]
MARLAIAAGALAVLTLVAIVLPRLWGPPAPAGSPSASPTEPTPSARTTAAAATPSSAAPEGPPPPPPSRAQYVLGGLSLEQRAGQVMMVGSPVAGPDAVTLDALGRTGIGNVFLRGRTTAGAAAVAGAVAAVRAPATVPMPAGPVAPFVATDQEGGHVQIMRGPGFSNIPSARTQGTMDPADLRAAAAAWGRELAAVGVNVNFGPVLDTVPSPAFAPYNAPIGRWEREYGYTPEAVSTSGLAFAQGMADAGVAATPKHFPGLGRATANTDTSADVADPEATRSDPYLVPFRDAVRAGAWWVMLSNALYPGIDPGSLAVFSPTVIQGMLRGDLGFTGVVVSDDVCDAVQLSAVPPERRGADFIAAGGSMALCTNAGMAPRLWQGIVDRARADPAFAQALDAAALAVLEAKERAGLLPG